MERTAPPPVRRHRPVEHAHPSPVVYVKVALVLAIVTAAEVGVYYVDALHQVIQAMIALLVFLALTKFTLVVSYYMHLRFDSKMFRRVFVAGLVLAIAVYTIVLVTFTVVVRPT